MMDAFKVPLVFAGRVLLALMFVMAGFGKLTNIAGTAGYIASAGLPAPSALAVLAGLLEVIAGIALIVGYQARWAALALAIFTLLAAAFFHKFWAVAPPQQMVQQLMFMKNLSVAGGLLVVAALGAGPFSLDSRRAAAGGRAALA